MVNDQLKMEEKENVLIKKIAWQVYNEYLAKTAFQNQVSIGDLMHYGMIGYLDARKKYDAGLGGKWSDYLGTRVKGTMIDKCLRKLPIIHIPQDKRHKVKQLMTAREELNKKGSSGRDDLAAYLGWSIDQVYEVETLQPHVISIEGGGRGKDGGCRPKPTVHLPSRETPVDSALRNEISTLISICLEDLSPLNRLVINGRFFEEMTLKELSRLLDCAVQRVHQRQQQALARLKKCFEANGWQWDEDLGI